MASSTKYIKAERKHKKEWENENWAKGWLKAILDAPLSYQTTSSPANASWCFACKVSLRSHKIDLKKHADSTKHKSTMLTLFKQNKIIQFVNPTQSKKSKIMEIKLAVFIAKHSSVASTDHLSTLLKYTSSKDSPLQELALHRTKCSAIIKKIVSPTLLENLIGEIGNTKYSLIVDESTDVSQTKWMSICVRYFNEKKLKVETSFLGLYLVEEATAEHLFNSLSLFLEKVGLKISNMIAIGTDGANNLCGKNKSLFTHLKKVNPQIMLVKCTCHSLHLCCSKASKSIPTNADFLIKEIYNYFSNSPLRIILYKRAFDLINTGVDSNSFRKLVQISGTRWLSFGAAIRRILEQWVELKYHFSLISTAENDKTAQIIYREMCDENNRLFLLFISPIVNDMNSLNLEFQSDNMDAGSMHQKLYSTLLSISTKIFKQSIINSANNSEQLISNLSTAIEISSSFLPLSSIDFGSSFETNLSQVTMDDEEVTILQENCFLYLKTLIKELIHRLPENMNLFRAYEHFTFLKCCSSPSHSKFVVVKDFLKAFINPNVHLDTYETQWEKLPFINWVEYFNNEIPSNLHHFWTKVYDYKDTAGTYHFKDIALAVLYMLVIPTSNASVERVFSIMNSTKTRIRNRMQYELLDAILRIVNYLNVNNICCTSFTPSQEMLNKFNSHTMYSNKQKHDECLENEVFNILDLN